MLQGLVLTPDCRPVAGAAVDLWHCDERGRYDNSGFRYRGHQFTDAAGAFRFETIRPGHYTGRTPHFHVKVQGERTRALTTQLYFPDLRRRNAGDFIYREELLLRLDPDRRRVARAVRFRAGPGLRPPRLADGAGRFPQTTERLARIFHEVGTAAFRFVL